MRICWYGHAAFMVQGHNERGQQRRVILDPYNYPDCGGYLPINEGADVVSISHDNPRYHSDISAIKGKFQLAQPLEFIGQRREIGGVTFNSHLVFENLEKEGPNAMIRFNLDGISVAHLGDLGHPLDEGALEFLSGVDILLALAGGPPTIELKDLLILTEKLQPPLVIPMHFRTPKVNLNIQPLKDLIALWRGTILQAEVSEYIIDRATIPTKTTLLILDHAR
jgi:L-ascorbate metabolism protein UlaG (beta-lactamase superfamily)